MSGGRKPAYRSGDHWVECQRCAFTYRNSEMKKEWTGLIVCKPCYEPRHPQDFVRAVQDNVTPQGHVNPTRDIINEIGYVDACYWNFRYAENDFPCFDPASPPSFSAGYVTYGYWAYGYTTADEFI